MLGIDSRTLKIAWTLFLLALVLILLYQIRSIIIVFALALFLAHLLTPLVDLLVRLFAGKIHRTASLAIAYVIFIGVIVSLGILIGSTIVQQASTLASKLPATIQSNPLERIPLPSWLEGERDTLNQSVDRGLQQLGASIIPNLSQAARDILSGLSGLLIVILIPILSFLFLKTGRELRLHLLSFFSDSSRPLVDSILDDLHAMLSQYIRALIFLCLATFCAYSSFLSLARVSYPVLLAAFAATLEFIPVLGALIGAVTIVLVSLISGYGHPIVVIAFLAVYRVFQDYVLSPYLMSAGVEVPPLLVLFGLLAGEKLGGIPGMFFSVPVIAALRTVLGRMRKSTYVV
ncbi:MAG TPA: AI-2E family transporter [Bryobacteraceae bacterium]